MKQIVTKSNKMSSSNNNSYSYLPAPPMFPKPFTLPSVNPPPPDIATLALLNKFDALQKQMEELTDRLEHARKNNFIWQERVDSILDNQKIQLRKTDAVLKEVIFAKTERRDFQSFIKNAYRKYRDGRDRR